MHLNTRSITKTIQIIQFIMWIGCSSSLGNSNGDSSIQNGLVIFLISREKFFGLLNKINQYQMLRNQ